MFVSIGNKLAACTLAISLLAGCSPETFAPVLPVNTPIQTQRVADINPQYVITAQALIDKIVSVSNPTDQTKIKKDFELNIRSLNRYALQNLCKYAVKVLQTNLKPGEDPLKSPVVVLIYPILERVLDIMGPMIERYMDMIFIVEATNPNEQEKQIQRFTQQVKRLPKVDIRELMKKLQQNDNDLFTPSPVTQRLMGILQATLNQ